MENRLLLSADAGHNFLLPADVNNDHLVKPTDALAVINQLSQEEVKQEQNVSSDVRTADQSILEMFYDVNDDGMVSPSDALAIINQLANDFGSEHSSTLLSSELGFQARAELERRDSGSVTFEVRIVGAPAGAQYDVMIAEEPLGTMRINSRGQGEFERTYAATDVPAALLAADTSTSISIGDLVSSPLGELAQMEWSSDTAVNDSHEETEDEPEHRHGHREDQFEDELEHDDDSGSDSVQNHLSSRLEIEFNLSLSEKLELHVQGGPENDLLDVTVSGNTIGQLATNAFGNGELELEFDDENAPLPEVLSNVSDLTSITIENVFEGTLGELRSR
ncbi:dockerin type I domain-containing protein [Stieleria sp. JC731]|nr:dockerin type I domain-containing protein [Stieleria sp. JC731]